MKLIIPIKAMSVNSYVHHTRGGRYYSKKGKEFRNEILQYICDIDPTDKILEVKIDFIFKTKRRRDVDNYIKPLLDLLNKRAWVDDVQIKRIIAEKHIGEKENKIIIEWKEI